MLNLIIPIGFFAILLVFKCKSHTHFIGHHQVVMGLGVLGLMEAILLIDTEVTLAKNKHLVEAGETDWTFGQTLAVLVLLVPFRDLLQSVFDQGAQKQRRRLLLSAVNGAKGMVQVLLDLGADKHDLNALLRNRSENGDWEMVKLLFENGADPDEPIDTDYLLAGKKGETAFILATRQEHQKIIKVFVEQDAHVYKQEINKQIYLAAVMNYPISLKFLLEKHADCKAKDGKECLALLLAAAENKTEAVKFLLKHNLDVHVKDEFEQTALHIATTKGHEATVKLLLEHDANVHVKGIYGQTPLYSAAQSGHQNIVKLLLENNADINARINVGQTALHAAAQNGHQNTVKLLLDHNADIHARGAVSAQVDFYQVKSAPADGHMQTPLLLAAQNGHQDTLNLLFNYGADVDVNVPTEKDEQTPLLLAAERGKTNIVKLLLEHNADINFKDKNQQTALHLATWERHPDTVKLLLDHNANIHIRDKNKQTPLHLAVPLPLVGFMEEIEVVKFLLKHNADVHATGKVSC
ncbi:hypothetical protein E4T56_gene8043 [Termitomyces sp. T112]|nr:hypothetical protein E4T56_gene8043 [Termitomyces sp. T112]